MRPHAAGAVKKDLRVWPIQYSAAGLLLRQVSRRLMTFLSSRRIRLCLDASGKTITCWMRVDPVGVSMIGTMPAPRFLPMTAA
jgi:hypothetical protein